jgi:hypothetical protein
MTERAPAYDSEASDFEPNRATISHARKITPASLPPQEAHELPLFRDLLDAELMQPLAA